MKTVYKLILIIFLLSTVTVSLFAQMNQRKSELERRVAIAATARSVEGTPYRFNGSTPEGFDSTGFIVYVFYKNGITLPKNLQKIYRIGAPVSPQLAKPGDILFFTSPENSGRSISHGGIYLGKRAFIHMPVDNSIVRIDHIRKGNMWSKLFVEVRTYSRMYTEVNEEINMPVDDNTPVNSGGYEESEYQ